MNIRYRNGQYYTEDDLKARFNDRNSNNTISICFDTQPTISRDKIVDTACDYVSGFLDGVTLVGHDGTVFFGPAPDLNNQIERIDVYYDIEQIHPNP